MEIVHSHKSEQKKRKRSPEDSEKDTACPELRTDTPKTKKKKKRETMEADTSNADFESENISHVKKQKKRTQDKNKIEKDKNEEDKTSEMHEEDATKAKSKKKSKKKDKDKETKSFKQEIVETSAHINELLKTEPDETFEKGDTEVKRKKRKKKNSQGKGSSENLPTSLLDDADESENAPTKALRNEEEDETERTGGKKSKKSRIKDKVKSSLGTVDVELVESTAKNLQINGLDVSNVESSKDTDKSVSNNNSLKDVDGKKSLSTEKQKKKKKRKKDKKTGKKDDKKSDQNAVNVSRCDRALNYLRLWNVDKDSWKFNKMNQTQLLHMIYDTSLVNDADFQILLLYLADMKGQAKEKTHNEAMKLVDGDAENGQDVDTIKEQRAREIVQVLS